jgi:hypothetical protein
MAGGAIPLAPPSWRDPLRGQRCRSRDLLMLAIGRRGLVIIETNVWTFLSQFEDVMLEAFDGSNLLRNIIISGLAGFMMFCVSYAISGWLKRNRTT